MRSSVKRIKVPGEPHRGRRPRGGADQRRDGVGRAAAGDSGVPADPAKPATGYNMTPLEGHDPAPGGSRERAAATLRGYSQCRMSSSPLRVCLHSLVRRVPPWLLPTAFNTPLVLAPNGWGS